MKAIEVAHWSSPGELRASEVPRPVCGPDEVLIRVRASPVSFALSLMVAGRYQRKPALPFVPGNTVAGTILEIGANAGRNLVVGQRVVASIENGGLAEEAVAPAATVYPIPRGISFAAATAFNTSYNSVVAALTWPRLLNLLPGQTLLVNGAAGGVGTAAIEIAKHLGAGVIATASTPAKRQWAMSRGAAHAIDSTPEALRGAVMDLTGGSGVDSVLDPVGGELFTQSLRCLKPEGRILPIGFASGKIPEVPANILLVKNISVCGLYMGYYKIDQRERFEPLVRGIFEQLGHWYEKGVIEPHVSTTFPLEQTADAFAAVLDRGNIGHVVVTMD